MAWRLAEPVSAEAVVEAVQQERCSTAETDV
jgi:hypothetical protein